MTDNAVPIFTEHVLTLRPDATPPSPHHMAAMWGALRGALVVELRRRGLWHAPPTYLGIYGASTWAGEALEELMLACYASAFLSRLRSLHAQLKVRRNIEGLIFLNIRNFLHDTQRKYDPLGFRVFNLLRSAVLEEVEAGGLHVLDGNPEVRNTTVLGPALDSDPEEADGLDLAATAQRWNGELLPDLVTALGKAQVTVVTRLRHLLQQLPAQGVTAFRFRDVCRPLKEDARRRWAAVWQSEDDELAVEDLDEDAAKLVRQVGPDRSLDDHDSFTKLLRCVAARLDNLDQDAATGGYLRKLWVFLRCHASDTPAAELGAVDPGRPLPSRRKLAQLLSIPRDRLPTLFSRLGELVEGCRGHFRNAVVTSPVGSRADSQTGRNTGS